jgi:hypothetical protein
MPKSLTMHSEGRPAAAMGADGFPRYEAHISRSQESGARDGR